jgi:glycosyltransferase involved in cell wall biosynthesis
VEKSLTIFVPHCSDLLTDCKPHGDGLIAHGFISNLARRGHSIHVAAQDIELRQPLPRNVNVYEISLTRSGVISSRVEYMLRVRSLLAQLRKTVHFDLIHQLNPVFTGMSLSLLGSDIPVVLGTYFPRWPEDLNAMPWKRWRAHALAATRDLISRAQQRQANALVLTTPAAWKRIPNPQSLYDRVHFLPIGIDTKLFSPASEPTPGEDGSFGGQRTPSILFFAHVLKKKGIFTLVDAFPTVAREFPTVTLRIAGDGPDLAETKRRVAALGCAPQVEFIGRQDRMNAPDLYRNCSLYCFPSFGEPYGNTLIEAMSCGKAVVVTNTGGPPHIVSPEGGKCVPAGNADALSKTLIDLLRDPERLAAMGRHNRQIVESTMSWDKVTTKLESIYEVVLSRSSGNGHANRRFTTVNEHG